MKGLLKKAIIYLYALTVPLSYAALAEAPEKTTVDYTLYVSCDGNDTAPGTEAQPLKTLEGARSAVKNILSKSNEVNIDVIFKGGDYRFEKMVKFDESDSPAEGYRVQYMAAEGEEVNFKGSKELDISKIKLVEEQKILKRLPESARGKVGELDLSEQGIGRIDKYNPGVPDSEKMGDVQFYLNGVAQIPAQWPNGEGHYAHYTDVLTPGDSTGAGGKFVYEETEPSAWGEAKDFYIKAYFSYDYQEYRILGRAVHPEEKSIELEGGLPGTPIQKNSSQRWKAVNLLEALDMPGEWYIDRDENILYYYPQKSLKDAKFEIAVMDENMIYLDGTDNLTFSGINFSQTRKGCIQGINYTENIIIENCKFSHVANNVIATSGTINSFVDKKYTDSYKTQINGAYGWQIRNNTFVNVGKMAIYLVGGDRGTLKSSGNVIENNYIYKPMSEHKGSAAITVQYGCGDVIRNNVIHNSPGHAIDFNGNNYKILNNELYNASREVSDTGIIYTYRSFSARGTEIAYNFIHDGMPVDPKLSVSNNGIYWDDNTTGQSAHHNIFANIYRAICANGGTDNTVTNNIFVDCAFATHLNTNFLLQEGTQERHRLHYESVANSDVWQKAYPNMKPLVEEYMGIAALNVCKDNYAVRCNYTIYDEVKEYGDVDNNLLGEDNNAFVDFNNGDYRLKESDIVLDADYDMKQIGIQGEEKPDILYSDFEQIYPSNGETAVPAEKMTFSWEESVGADQYRIVVATDPELKNVIIDDTAHYNWYEAENLNPDIPIYYWKVYAKNNSYHYKNEWESDNAVFAFAVKENDEVDTSELEKAMEEAENLKSIMLEGENPGDFRVGTKEEIQRLINESNELMNTGAKQTAVNAQINKIKSYLADDSYIVPGYVDINDFSADKWVFLNEDSKLTEKGVIFKNSGSGGYTGVYYDSKKAIYRFRMKMGYEGENPSWIGLGIRGHVGTEMYNTGNDCYFLVIKNNIIELQKNVMGAAIVKEYENNCFEYGKWHDVEFGAIDLGQAVQIILNVDGKNIINYIDSSSNAIEKTGNLLMTARGKNYLEIEKPETTSVMEYNDVVLGGLESLMAGYYKEMSVNGRDVSMIKVGVGYYANKNGVTKYMGKAPFILNGKTMISLGMLKDLFECTSEGYILNFKGNTIEFTDNSDICIVNNEEKTLSVACVTQNGELFVPFKDFCDMTGTGLLWQDSGIIITGEALSVSEQNNGTLLKNIAIGFDKLKEY